MLEKSELGTSVVLVEFEVGEVEAVDVVGVEDAVESKEAVMAPVRFIFLSMWTSQIIMFHRRYGISYVVLQSVKFLILSNARHKFLKNSKYNREPISVASGITLSA